VTALLRGPLLVDQVGDPAVTTSSCQGGQDQPHQPDPHEDDEHRDGEDDGHGGLLLSLLAEWSEVQPAGDLLVQRWWMSPSPPRHAHAGRVVDLVVRSARWASTTDRGTTVEPDGTALHH